jgi:hypothetical protein
MYYRQIPFQTYYPSTSLEKTQVGLRLDYETAIQTVCPTDISQMPNCGNNSDEIGRRNIAAVIMNLKKRLWKLK